MELVVVKEEETHLKQRGDQYSQGHPYGEGASHGVRPDLLLRHSYGGHQKRMAGHDLDCCEPERQKHETVDQKVDKHREENFNIHIPEPFLVLLSRAMENVEILEGIGDVEV